MCIHEGSVGSERFPSDSCPKNFLECDDLIPINISIVGQWRPVKSINTDEYLRKRGASYYQDLLFRLGTQKFQVKDKRITFSQHLNSEKAFETVAYLDQDSDKPKVMISTSITDNTLTSSYDWKEKVSRFEQEDRFIEDGRLYIINKGHGTACTRIYERIEVFHLGGVPKERAIEQEIMGTWKKMTSTGIRELVNCLNMGDDFANLWGSGFKFYGQVDKNTIQMTHFITHHPHLINTRQMVIWKHYDEGKGVKIVTSYEDNALVTVEYDKEKEISRTARFVLAGHLFVVLRREGFQIISVYEKMGIGRL